MARRQTEARVGDICTRTIPAVPEHLTIAAARKVAALKQVEALFVERDGRLVGLLDERALAAAPDDTEARAAMTAIDLCLHPGMGASDARALFMRSGTSILPVTFGALLLGSVARSDLDRALARPSEAPRRRASRWRAAA